MRESNLDIPAYEQRYGDIGIAGYPFPPCRVIADIYCPRLCNYKGLPEEVGYDLNLNPRRQAPQLDHIDLVKVWKGLSSDKAEELLFWESKFREALVDMLKSQIQLFDLYSDSLSDLGQSRSEAARLRYFAVDIVDLAISMVTKAKLQGLPSFRWFTSSGNIYTAVAQFIQTHDCFTYTGSGVEGLSIGVILRRKSRLDTFPLMPALVEAQWNPDFLSFDQWEYIAVEGDTFCLRPHYRSPSRGWDLSSFPSDSGLHFTSSASWLKWDYAQSAFTGMVPFFSGTEERQDNGIIAPNPSDTDKSPYALGIIVTATMTEYFSGGVCYEQTVRARITINVARRPSRDQVRPADNQASYQIPVEVGDSQEQSESPRTYIPDQKWPCSVFRDNYLGLNDASSLAPGSSKSFASYGRPSNNFDFLKGFLSSPLASSYYGSPGSHLDEGLKVFPLRYCTETDRQPHQQTPDVVLQSLQHCFQPSRNDQVDGSPDAKVVHPSPRRVARQLEAWDEPSIAIQLEELADQQGFPRHFRDDTNSEGMDVESKLPKDEGQSLHVPPRSRSISGASVGSIQTVNTSGSGDTSSPVPFGEAIDQALSGAGQKATLLECTSEFPKHYRATRIKAQFFIGPDDDSRTSSPEKQKAESSQPPDIEMLGKYHPMISSRVNSIRGRKPAYCPTPHDSQEELEQPTLTVNSGPSSPTHYAGNASPSTEAEDLEQYSEQLLYIFKEGASKMPEWTASDCEDMLECGSLGSSLNGGMTPHPEVDDQSEDYDVSRKSSGTALNSVASSLALTMQQNQVRQISV